MDPLYDKGCAQWAHFLSPSPLPNICQPEVTSSLQAVQLRTSPLPFSDLGEISARELCWESSDRADSSVHGSTS